MTETVTVAIYGRKRKAHIVTNDDCFACNPTKHIPTLSRHEHPITVVDCANCLAAHKRRLGVPKGLVAQHRLIREDVRYIEDKYGKTADYCGAWCNNDKMDELLATPTYEKCIDIYRSMLLHFKVSGYMGRHGYDTPLPTDDQRLNETWERWQIERPY